MYDEGLRRFNISDTSLKDPATKLRDVGEFTVFSAEKIRAGNGNGNGNRSGSRRGADRYRLALEKQFVYRERKRAMIDDTLHEIGGDGDIRHLGIGNARRMPVPDTDMKHKINTAVGVVRKRRLHQTIGDSKELLAPDKKGNIYLSEGSKIGSDYGAVTVFKEEVQIPPPSSVIISEQERGVNDELYDQLEQAMAEADSSK
ncbi:hypothetical protein Tco_0907399 [Tanacetum coccineum]|uniref:Uncharacterized protein n=1 Tax=Tanacetum coccineum TaxID=301880 RepID=A0ABQ5CK84_9ASTR